MKKYAVTLVQTITREVMVEGTSAQDVERVVETYGLTEVFEDYPLICESVRIEVRKAKKIA